MSRPLNAQIRAEVSGVVRNGEQLLLTLGIPVLLLAFFSLVDVLPTGTDDPVDFLAPGILALAIMSTAMVSLGIATGFERGYKVLKRLGATPLGRRRLVLAKITAVALVEILQLVVLVLVAVALGWSPAEPDPFGAILAVLVGTTAFAGLGLTIAGRLRAEVNLAAQNGLYLVLLLLGGMVIPLDELPTPLRALARLLPSGALSDVVRDALTGTGDMVGWSWMVLVTWAVVAPAAATRWFRWE